MLAYVLEAVFLGDSPWRDFAALAVAPLHMLWKLAITPTGPAPIARERRVGPDATGGASAMTELQMIPDTPDKEVDWTVDPDAGRELAAASIDACDAA